MNNHLKMRCFIVFMLLSCFCCENVFSQVQKVSVNVRNADRKSTRLNSSHLHASRMPSSA